MTRAWDRVVRTQSDEWGREIFTSELFSNRPRDWPERGEREAPKCRTWPPVLFGPHGIFNKVHLLSTLKYWEISLKRSRFRASHKKINTDMIWCCIPTRQSSAVSSLVCHWRESQGPASLMKVSCLVGWRKFWAWGNEKQWEEGAYVELKKTSLCRAYTNWEHVGGSREKLSGSGRRHRPCGSGEVGVWDAELWAAHETIQASTE